MKSGDRLNQIEPLVAEMLIKLDETAAKVDKVSEDVTHLRIAMQKSNDIASKQSDTISFLLENQMLTNDKMDQMKDRLDKMDNNLNEMRRGFVEHMASQQEIKLIQESILTLLKNKN
ncbi:hypothetical protein [Dyadobacter frigoris]|uniref:Uncharacterized protein n=1 Tax=Dyadobacter frigoris TaxID=2576211 RepID=A0A4U6D3T3_9BACT|nr:hypothetical protein [Dyadobacter frigoris]TKT88584.1 hypothetical protein FDK13_26930 [Dyadobacter frigoris]GLU54636.1 hypothetical protein Dfri01_40970 [Dyadobacter frigoris]